MHRWALIKDVLCARHNSSLPTNIHQFNPHNDPLRWGEEACGKQNKRTPKMSVSYVTQNLDARVTCNR